MVPVIDRGIVGRIREAFELYDLGLAMMLQNLRRRFSDESEAEIRQRLLDWRLRRRDAPSGDADGRVVPFPRPRS